MKLFLAAIILFIISGCKDNIVNHYIEVPKHDTVKVKCDSTDWGNDDDQDGHGHHHHRKPHLREDD